jgi:hypothetical protein
VLTMTNKTNQFNYLVVYQYIRHGIELINCLENDCEEEGIILEAVSNPEHDFMKKESYERLSDEAKEVIDIVLNSPNEILELFTTPKQQKISAALLKNVLSKTWKSRFIVENVFKELKQWVNQL